MSCALLASVRLAHIPADIKPISSFNSHQLLQWATKFHGFHSLCFSVNVFFSYNGPRNTSMALSVAADCKRLSVSSMWSVSLREVVSAVGSLLIDKKN